MKEKHQREIDNLQMELQKMTMNSSLYSRNTNEKSMEIKSSEHEGQTRNEIYLLEREDGEVINYNRLNNLFNKKINIKIFFFVIHRENNRVQKV